MKALTLIQPWATLVALGEKQIETRSWDTKYRGPLAIHAGKKIDKSVFDQPYYKEIFEKYNITASNIPTGSIIATCNLSNTQPTEYLHDIISSKEFCFGNYSPNRFGWMLSDVHILDNPIPAKGMLGLWEFDELN